MDLTFKHLKNLIFKLNLLTLKYSTQSPNYNVQNYKIDPTMYKSSSDPNLKPN